MEPLFHLFNASCILSLHQKSVQFQRRCLVAFRDGSPYQDAGQLLRTDPHE